jgi:hypothetical protein
VGQGAVSDAERAAVMKYAGNKGAVSDLENARKLNRIANARKYLSPAQQAEFAAQESQTNPTQGVSPAAAAASAPVVNPMGDMTGPAMKKGGKATKKC